MRPSTALQNHRNAMAFRMHYAEHQDAQKTRFPRMPSPWLFAPRRKGDVVCPLVAQIWVVIGIVAEELAVLRTHIARLVEKELTLL